MFDYVTSVGLCVHIYELIVVPNYAPIFGKILNGINNASSTIVSLYVPIRGLKLR